MKDSPVSETVDFDKDGIQHGFLKLPHSHDDSAWGSIVIPITVAKNGDGPTILFTGANHGDEYEGPVALFDLANNINSEDIKGRVIIIPGIIITRPESSLGFISFAKSNNATGPSYSSPWFAPVNNIVGPTPFLATVIGITMDPQADSSCECGSLRNPCWTPSFSKSTVELIGDSIIRN